MQKYSSVQPNSDREALGRFVREQNIAHYRKRLSETTDAKERQVLRELLAGELAREVKLG